MPKLNLVSQLMYGNMYIQTYSLSSLSHDLAQENYEQECNGVHREQGSGGSDGLCLNKGSTKHPIMG